MAKHIGIVACSAEGAALCYRTICESGDHPEVSLHGHSLRDYVTCIDADNWRGVAELMLSSANHLNEAGAEFLICPDNTIHRALPFIEDYLPLPWLHIADVVAKEAASRRLTKLGLTGTRWMVESDVYPRRLTALGMGFERPDDPDRREMSRIIMEELVHGVFLPQSVATFVAAIGRLRDQGCDGVILGCTEIPLIIGDHNSPLPVLDSTRLLARAALDFAYAE